MTTTPGARDLVLAAAAIILVSRLVEGPMAWLVGALLLGLVAVGLLQVLGEAEGTPISGVPLEALVTPAIAAAAGLGTIRLVPVGVVLVPAIAVLAWFVGRTIRTEAHLVRSLQGPSAGERTAVLSQAIVVAFLAFTGVAALVPGGLPEPAGSAPIALGTVGLAGLAGVDAVIAFGLGFRMAALRSGAARDIVWFALTSAIAVAVGALALRAIGTPRLLGPALLALVLFLWDAVHSQLPSGRRDPRRIWETILLVVLAIVVLAWSLRATAV
jgi:hypothetical protein